MDTGSRYLHLDSSSAELVRQLIRAIEGLQAKPESVAAGVQPQEAAPMPIELGRSAGREPCLTDAIASVHDRRAYYFNLSNMKDGERYTIIVKEYDCLLRELKRIEARRCSTGCAEPPAG